jgi:predicted nucleotidyltransferase
MTKNAPFYPTLEHQKAADAITDHFIQNYNIDAVLLVNSCARGKATRDSCLDIIMLVKPGEDRSRLSELEAGWSELERSSEAVQDLYKAGKYSVVHPDFISGDFTPGEQDEAAGPDDFELQVGNFLAYSVPLWQGSKKSGSPTTTRNCACTDWKEYAGSASTTCTTSRSTSSGDFISSPLTGFITPTKSSSRHCSSPAGPIQSHTTNGSTNKW